MNQEARKPKLKKSDVYIINVDDRLLVRPAVVVVRGNQTLDICNLTGEQAAVTLTCIDAGTISIAPGDWEEVTVGPQSAAGAHTYGVAVGGRKAHGESDPVIIIDPPGN